MYKLILSLLLIIPSISFGINMSEVKDLSGFWVLKVDKKNLFVIKLIVNDDKKITGYFEKPKKLESVNTLFQVLENGKNRENLVDMHKEKNKYILTFVDSKNEKNEFVARIINNKMMVQIKDLPPESGIGPWLFVRSDRNESVSENWEINRSYTLNDASIINRDLSRIYEEDQSDRVSLIFSKPETVSENDSLRVKKIKSFVNRNELNSSQDYREAAFILQHGSKPNDYLLAHTLAMIAVSKGNSTAIWIAAASLDRYLLSIGKKQIYGTQSGYNINNKIVTKFSQPTDNELIPNHIRNQLGVPTPTPNL